LPKPLAALPVLLISSFLVFSSCGDDLFLRLATELSEIVTIDLSKPMLDARGNKVTSVQLVPGTAAILRYIETDHVVPATVSNNIRAGKSVRLGGYFFGGWADGRHLSSKQLEWIARTFDVLTLNNYYVLSENNLNGGITPDQVLWLKKQNPQLKYYSMLFATTLREPLFDPARMSLGVRRGHDLDANHLMDLGNKDYAHFFRDYMIEHAKQYHADGVAIDEIMWNGYWGVDMADVKNYTSVEQIRQTCYDWLKIVKTDNPKEVIHQAFWPEAQAETDGVWGEASFFSWMRNGYRYEVFYEKMDYSEILTNLSAYGQKNKTYIWAAAYDASDFRDLEYSIATYLLGKNGNYVVFQPHPVYDGGYPHNLSGYDISTCIKDFEKNTALFDIELGEPLGEFYTKKIHGKKIWVRKFTGGIVFSNANR